MRLREIGWTDSHESAFEPHRAAGLEPARVATENRGHYRLCTSHGELPGEIAGSLRYRSEERSGLPVVGDWVAAQLYPEDGFAVIVDRLPRHSQWLRRAAGQRAEAQVLAANLDHVLVLTACGEDFSPRRVERYLAQSRAGGCPPVVVLSKTDLDSDPAARLAELREVAGDAPLLGLSTWTGDGLAGLDPYLAPAKTVALVGSSGAGKSTLINHLAGRPVQRVQEVRQSDQRGRHTTTQSTLLRLAGGALLIDTPGLREVGLWHAEDALQDGFPEIEALTSGCRFRDCGHRGEPGCAVEEAARRGEVDPRRLEAWNKLRREADWIARREEGALERRQRRRQWGLLIREARQRAKDKGR